MHPERKDRRSEKSAGEEDTSERQEERTVRQSSSRIINDALEQGLAQNVRGDNPRRV